MTRPKDLGFEFPRDRHLIATTANQVLCWNAQGITTIFRSRSGGILAAKESKDGKGRLAIADSQIVLLHDCQRGSSKTQRLKGADDQFRLLEYSQSSEHLYFTTSLQNAIQRYSITESRILDPAHSHPSPPTVLAISPNSHLLLTASTDPPVVYLQNIVYGASPLLLHPTASTTAVSVAAFHPERSNIFLLGFADGTIAAYNANKICREDSTKSSAMIAKSGRSGEISHLKGLHRVLTRAEARSNNTSKERNSEIPDAGGRSASIVAAAFMPGCETRAVTVGADGKCRLIDFHGGVTILRTWKMKAPATSLSILALKPAGRMQDESHHNESRTQNRKQSTAIASNRTTKSGATLTDSIIAIGRVDGKVALYDSIGSMLTEKDVDPQAGHIIQVEWIEGPSPKPVVEPWDKEAVLKSGGEALEFEDLPFIDCESRSTLPRTSSASLKRKRLESFRPVDGSFGEDEMKGSTKRRPQSSAAGDANPKPSADYMDLFSPIKSQSQGLPVDCDPGLKGITTKDGVAIAPDRPRRLQSDPTSPCKSPSAFPPSNDFLNLPKSTNSPPQKDEAMEHVPPSTTSYSLMSTGRSFRRMPGSFADDSSSLDSTRSVHSRSSGNPSEQSNILADLKRVGGFNPKERNAIALFAPYMKPVPKLATHNSRAEGGKGDKGHLQDESSERNISSETVNADIWLDSFSPHKPSHSRGQSLTRSAHHQTVNTSHRINRSPQGSAPRLHGPPELHPDSASEDSSVVDESRSSRIILTADASSVHAQPSTFSLTSSDDYTYTSRAPSPDSLHPTRDQIRRDHHSDSVSALHPEGAIEGEPSELQRERDRKRARRCSWSRAVEFLSPKKRDKPVGESGPELVAEARRKEKQGREKERTALKDLVLNEIANKKNGRDPAPPASNTNVDPKTGKISKLEAKKSKVQRKPEEKSKGQTPTIWHVDLQPTHRCHCTECPELRRELQELRDEMEQLKTQMLTWKRNE